MVAALVLVSIYAALATMAGILFYKELVASRRSKFDYQNMIQKKTCAICFDVNGKLISDLDASNSEHAIKGLRQNQNIKDYNGPIKDLNNYFNMCIKYRRTVSYKVEETRSGDVIKRTDLIFSPYIRNGELLGIAIISQIVHTNNREAELVTKALKLTEKNREAETKISELDAERSELELAFKKSSQQHIKLQKAMYRIEQQKQELENALGIINHQKEDLEKMNAEIARSNHMKDVFLANTSHEIRTPLNAIIGFTNLLLKMEGNAKQFKYLENIKNAGNSLLFIINDILDLSKIEAGKIELERIRFNLRELIETCVNTVSVKRDNKEITVDIDVDASVPKYVKGDPYRINQILTNLINNAIKFTGSDCRVRLKVHIISQDDEKIELGFSVADNGIGIPKDKLSDIFQSFTQANEDTTRKYGGTGLGLSITKELVEMYGGQITVESELNCGATFIFNLILEQTEQTEDEPVAVEATNEQQMATDNANLTAQASLHILLVEDNAINQQLAIDTLKSWNSNAVIDIAGNGQIAVEKVVNTLYDVILMDIQMPVMDGNSATAAIRRLDSPNGQVPIIAMTAHAFKEERDRCLSNGMNDYITKPFDPDELYGKICQYAGVQIEPAERPDPVAYSASGEGVGDGFDLSPLIEICAGGVKELSDIINVYSEFVPADIKELTAAVDNNNTEQVGMKIHSLKTAFGYMGMAEANKLVQAIKEAAFNDKQKAGVLLMELNDLWNKTIPKIRERIEALRKEESCPAE